MKNSLGDRECDFEKKNEFNAKHAKLNYGMPFLKHSKFERAPKCTFNGIV